MGLKVLAIYIAVHFIADFPLQSSWLATNKGKSHEIMFYHAAIYTSAFFLLTNMSGLVLGCLAVTHFFIDTAKARWKLWNEIWWDQILHIMVLIVLSKALVV